MMDRLNEQSKLNDQHELVESDDQASSYYYDDATNYETYRDEDDNDNESLTPDKNTD